MLNEKTATARVIEILSWILFFCGIWLEDNHDNEALISNTIKKNSKIKS